MSESLTRDIGPLRFILQPEKSDIFKFYKTHQETFWVVEEIDMSQDRSSWNKLDDDTKHFVKMILAFFVFADGLVNENIAVNFLHEITHPEVRAYYTQQMIMETVHAETYTMLLDFYVTEAKEKIKLFNSVETVPSIKKKAEWAERWLNDPNLTLDERLVAFSIIEGVFFSGCFCAVFWLKTKGVLPGLTHSNELISRDEGIHTDFACMLHRKYINHPMQAEKVREMMVEAIAIEKEFVCESLPVDMIGMNSDKMGTYIDFVANRLLTELGYPVLNNAKNPFAFMNMISIERKTNFFEGKVSEYKRHMLDNEFSLDETF